MKRFQFTVLTLIISTTALYYAEPQTPSKVDLDHATTDLVNHTWMSQLSDRVSLASLNIPGTHNSAALLEPFLKTAKCQTLSITEQLQAGVRFFDIRCRHEKDQFTIFHGPVYQHLAFDEVLNNMLAFLKRNTREALILSIKEEHLPKATTRSFSQTLQSYIDQNPLAWYTKNAIPQLNTARGKIVLLRRFPSAKPMGIPAIDWQHDGFYQGANLFIQDRFEIPNALAKWEIVERALQHSIKDESFDRLHLHFASGYTKNGFGLPNITQVSSSINQKLADYLSRAPHRRHGCLVLDFITPDLARVVYKLNFTPNK